MALQLKTPGFSQKNTMAGLYEEEEARRRRSFTPGIEEDRGLIWSGGTVAQEQSITPTVNKVKNSGDIGTTFVVNKIIGKRVDNWLAGHNNYQKSYQDRFSDRKFGYEDAYVSDSAVWLDQVGQNKSKLKDEADSILRTLDIYESYLDPKWVKMVREAIGSAENQQSAILENSNIDKKWWDNFSTDEMIKRHGSAENAYGYHQRADGYRKKYNGKTYAELSTAWGALADGEEKDWLGAYASSVDYDEKLKADIPKLQQEAEELSAFYDEAFLIRNWHKEYEMGGVPYDSEKMAIYNRLMNEYGGDPENVYKAHENKMAYITSAEEIKRLKDWASVARNEDFEKKSKYVSNGDELYELINSEVQNMDDANLSDLFPGKDPNEVQRHYKRMTDREIEVFNYYYATEGAEKAKEYLQLLDNQLASRAETAKKQRVYDYANKNWATALGASGASVVNKLGSAIEYLGDSAEFVLRAINGEHAKIDHNTFAEYASLQRKGVSDQVTWDINGWDAFDFVYNTGMSLLDSMAVSPMGGYGALALGLSAAADGTNAALDRGLNSGQAFWNGVFSGAFEMLFERMSIGNFKILKEVPGETKKAIFMNLAKNMLVNASEETLTEIANIAYDTMEHGEFANYTIEDIKNGKWKDVLLQVLEAGAGGAMMGFGSGVIATLTGKEKTEKNDKLTDNGAENGQQNAPQTPDAPQGSAINPTELIDGVIAKLNNAPADPVGTAVESFETTGTVSNKQASDILNSTKAVQQLVKEGGLPKLEGMTAAQKRQAVKDAVQRMAEQEMHRNTADSVTVADADTYGIRDQLRNHQDKLDAMAPQAEIQVPAEYANMDLAAKKQWVIEKLRPTNYKVERKGLGIIDFAKKRLKSAFNYLKKGSAEEVAFEAIPYVLENGVEITERDNHKGREYGTVTIAAPITINGKRGNMAVVVKKTDGNHYAVHRILTPDGSVFVLPEMANEAESTTSGESPKTGSLATTKDSASLEKGVVGNSEAGHRQTQTLIPDSNTIIPNDGQSVNTENGAVGAAEEDTNAPTYPLGKFSQHQRENWANSKRIVLFEGVQQFRRFIHNALNGKPQTNKKLYFGTISASLAAEIKTEAGIDVEGYNLSLGENEIRKINKSHGNESTETPRGQRAVTEADYLRIPDIVQSPDKITLSGKTYEGKPVIEFRQYNGNETSVVAAVVSDKRLDLFVQTTFINKKTGSIATPESVQADSFTPKATGGTAPINSISEKGRNVKTEGSVGAAEAGFSGDLYRQIYEYGNIPEGENAVRPDVLPKSTDGTDRVSYTARTVMEAKVTPDAFAELIGRETAKGGFSYIPITNSNTVEQAKQYITKRGWEAAKNDWTAAVRAGKNSSQLTAIGALLYNNAVNSGEYREALDILNDYQKSIRNSAQALQAARILKTLTPENRLYMIRKSIDQMVEDMHLDTEISLDDALVDEYVNAETEEARNEVIKKIQKQVAAQLPSSFMEKFTALRYVNMLGNFRTQLRNVVGNATMTGVRALHNATAAGLENIAHKLSGGKLKRTRSATVSRVQMAAARKDFDTVENMILDGGKFNDTDISDEFLKGVEKERRIFKSKIFAPMEGYRKVTNWAMEKGDIVFAKHAYARALAGYLKANGITETDYSKIDTAFMDDARLFAAKEAQEATFRDTNWLSGWVSKIGRRKDTPAVGKLISEGVVPFRKTPANVFVRAWEYSPLGVINSVYTSIKAMGKDSEITGAQVINSWAKTLTGSGIFLLGMLLQSVGLLSTGPDEDEKKEGFEDLNGWQNYAFTLPDGTNITIDSLTPSAIPLLMGAEMKKLIDENGFQLKDLEKALTSITQPMIEMSMLQGVNDTLDNIQYAESNLGQLLINSAVSYLMQGVTNTLFGQIERTFEDSRMTTYVDKDSELPDWLQKALGKASAKTPGWDYNQIPYINAWGEEEENPAWAINGAYNLFSPSYIEKGISNDVTQELNRLNEVQSDVNVYPSRPEKTVSVNKKDYNLSAEEYVTLAKKQGQTQKKLVEDLIASADYARLSDDEKAKAIGFAYEYAKGKAKGEVVPDHPGISAKWMKNLTGNIADGIIRYVAAGTTEKYNGVSIEAADYISGILDSLTKETKPDGGQYANVRDVQKLEAVVNAEKLTDKEQDSVLRDIMGDSLEAKYDKALAIGISADDFVEAYRKQTDTKGKGAKDEVILYFVKDLGLTEATAETLYKIYTGTD